MDIHVSPVTIKGIITAPSSKSYLQRAIAIAMCSQGQSTIKNYSVSNDADTAIQIARDLGATILIKKNKLIVDGIITTTKNTIINSNEAGLSARLFAPLAALFYKKVTLLGNGSLTNRPFHMVENALMSLGKTVKSNNGFLPLLISGSYKIKEITIDGSETSQLLTGLLITLPQLKHNTLLHVTNLTSKPYVNMTLDVLRQFNIEINHTNYQTFYITGNQKPKPITYITEGDWSGVAFLLVGAAITGNVLVNGLYENSLQADAEIMNVLKLCGANIHFTKKGVYVSKNKLKAFEFDCTDCPDLFPVLAALAVHCKGVSKIIGTDRLINKESNRALTIKNELKKLGVDIRLAKNTLTITGTKIMGANALSHNDHRIAMMLAILALKSKNGITIQGAECVAKSYPHFFNDLNSLVAK